MNKITSTRSRKRPFAVSFFSVILVIVISTAVFADPVPSFTASFDTPLTFTVYDDYVYVDPNSVITTTEDFSDGYIRYSVQDSSTGDSFSLFSNPDDTAAGAISVLGSSVYLGDGTTKKIIGTIDADENGQNGHALKISLVNAFTNNSFESGTLDGWTVDTSFPGLPGDTPSGIMQSASITSSTASSGINSLYMRISGNVSVGFGTAHGPSVISDPFEGTVGDVIAFDWRVQDTGDDADVYAYLVDGATQYLISYARVSDFQDWSTREFTLPVSSSSFRFKFICGTYDATGGLYVASDLWIDNIRVYSNDIDESVLQRIVRQIQYKCTDDVMPDIKTIDIRFMARDSTTHDYTKLINIVNVTGPFTSSVNIGGGIGYLGNKTASLNISGQNARHGIAQMMISNFSSFEGAVWTDFHSFSYHDLTETSGTNHVYVKLKDGLGNISTTSYASVILDTDKPYFRLSVVDPGKASHISKVISVECFDEHSGINHTKFASGMKDTTFFGTGGTFFDSDAIEVTQNGFYTFFAIDMLGNMCAQSIEVTQIIPASELKQVESSEIYLRYLISEGTELDPNEMVKMFDANKDPVTYFEFSAFSDNEAVISAGPDGTMLARGLGTAEITIADRVSGYSVSLSVRVENMDKKAAFEYTDLNPLNWAAASVKNLSVLNIFRGYDDGSFRPDSGISFKEFLIVYDRLKLYKNSDPYILRKDIDISLDEIDWAFYGVMDILNMLGNEQRIDLISSVDSFDELITRAQAAKIIDRAEALPLFTGSDYYSDIADSIYRDPINNTAFAGIFKGYANIRFEPGKDISRSEAAVIFNRMLK